MVTIAGTATSRPSSKSRARALAPSAFYLYIPFACRHFQEQAYLHAGYGGGGGTGPPQPYYMMPAGGFAAQGGAASNGAAGAGAAAKAVAPAGSGSQQVPE